MSIKDKIIFGLIVVLLIGGGYIQYTYTQILAVMDVLASQELYAEATTEAPIINTHVDQVNAEFSERLRVLELQFIGRAKHVKNNRDNIAANLELINHNTDSLSVMISDVQFDLDEFKRNTEKQFGDLDRDLRDMQDSFDSFRRRNTRKISDIEQSLVTLQNDIEKLNTEVFEKEQTKKK